MSVDVLSYNKDGKDCIGAHPVASEKFYIRCWVRGINENNIRLFREDREFDAHDLPEVMEELQRLRDWAVRELSQSDCVSMTERIDQLMEWLWEECGNEGGRFRLV